MLNSTATPALFLFFPLAGILAGCSPNAPAKSPADAAEPTSAASVAAVQPSPAVAADSTSAPSSAQLPRCAAATVTSPSVEPRHRVCSGIRRTAAPGAAPNGAASSSPDNDTASPSSDGMESIAAGEPLGTAPSNEGAGDPESKWKPGMRKPSLLCIPDVRATKKAQKNHTAGVLLARCVIDLDGRPCNCSVVKGLPDMDDAFLDALDTMRFEPIIYQGHPQRVWMVIPMRIHPSPPPPKPAE